MRQNRLSLAPTPCSPLATPPGRPGRILDVYGSKRQSICPHPAAANRKRGDRIRVCVRKRPLIAGDAADCVQADSSTAGVRIAQEKPGLDGISMVTDEHLFYFDHVFDESQTNQQVSILSLSKDFCGMCDATFGMRF
jgi:hypothetical protein